MQHSSWVGFGLKNSLCYQAWQKNCSMGLILWMESIPDLCETQFVFQLSRETGPRVSFFGWKAFRTCVKHFVFKLGRETGPSVSSIGQKVYTSDLCDLPKCLILWVKMLDIIIISQTCVKKHSVLRLAEKLVPASHSLGDEHISVPLGKKTKTFTTGTYG